MYWALWYVYECMACMKKITVTKLAAITTRALNTVPFFLATCNVILLLRDVKLPNKSLHYTPLMFSQRIENSSLISLINIFQE
jgi:hypothetical protein